jgi:hypothetical protein
LGFACSLHIRAKLLFGVPAIQHCYVVAGDDVPKVNIEVVLVVRGKFLIIDKGVLSFVTGFLIMLDGPRAGFIPISNI